MELQSNDGLHVIGGSIPAAPGIVFGHNEDVAWGATTARFDLADAYTETLTSNGDAVMRDGEPVELIQKEYTFDFPTGGSETVEYEWVPGHGPIIEKDTDNNTAISIKWTAHQPGPDLEFIQDLMRAESVDDAMAAVEPAGAINQSWTFMDAEGNIGWNPMGSVPDRRPWVDGETPNWLPLPGDGSAEWQGTLSPDQLPEMKNPPAGYLATANNDMDGSYTDGNGTNDGHTPWQHPPALGYRHKRIVDQLDADAGSHTVETMHSLQSDTYSLHAETILPTLLQTIDSEVGQLSTGAQTVVSTLDNWNYTCPTGLDGLDPMAASASSDADEVSEAAGCSAFHAMLPRLTDAIFGDELSAANIDAATNWDSFQRPLIYLLTAPDELVQQDAYLDDIDTEGTTETLADLLPTVLDETATELNDSFDSSDASDWLWGRIHTLTLESFFAQAGVDAFNYGPFASDGAFYTVDVANPNARGSNAANAYGHNVGASIRLVVRGSSDEGMEGWFQLPGGQDHHRDSQWYNSLLDEWLNDTRRPLLFEEAELEGRIEETWRIGPSSGN
jgi:penicillin amidase